ncbi:MAG: hypothetical protein ABSG79_15705 [Bryobacteraceae bacterium]|jgi:uncharacterized protein (TIGR03437 family)
MKIKNTSALFLTLLGATAGFAQVTLNTVPARAIGQSILIPESGNPNLVEGRELFQPQGIAVDNSASPPIVYVADTGNNRVLAWKNAASFCSAGSSSSACNGAFADLVIGQPDKYSTLPYGPGTNFSTGLDEPTGLAVYKGDLYVVDSGNNRVLRYPKPFSQTGQVFPDLYVGQPSLNSRVPNQPNGQVSAQGIFTNGNNQVLAANIAFDGAGNLWMTDPGNRRVLRFPAAAIAGGGGGLTADIEIGQVSFAQTQQNLDPTNANSPLVTNQFAVPDGIAFDGAGNLYVSDSDLSVANSTIPGRVLVFTASSLVPGPSLSATRIMGVVQQSASGTALSQSQIDNTVMVNPQGIVVLPNNQGIAVVDSRSSRIMLFPPFPLWQNQTTPFSPQATAIIGQASSCPAYPGAACRAANNGNPSPSASTMSFPSAVALVGTDLLIADAGNNRVVGMPQVAGAYVPTMAANRVLGQDRVDTFSINLIEGREFAFVSQNAQGNCGDAGMAIDSTGDTPHLYVADPCNNRVLGFNNALALKPGAKADIVIGQPDMQTALCNYPSGNLNQPTQSNLCGPIGVLVDSNGNLYVADSGNGRVLRFPTPFAHQGSLQPADRVVGQANFTTKITDPSASTMSAPYGLALSGVNGLLVSDVQLNRVLYFPMANGDLTSPQGEAATVVFGQQQFNVGTKPTTLSNTVMTAPHHVAADTSGRTYVVDTGDNRVMIFGDPHDPSTATSGANAVLIITGLNAPRGIYVSPLTGEIWVTDTGNSRCLRYPSFEQYFVSGTFNGGVPAYAQTLALTEDQYGDLLVADAANRVEFYYPGLTWQNAASFFTQALAPGVLATIYPLGGTFGTNTANANQLPNPVPFPTSLAGIEVLFNGQPAPVPLLLVSPGQINFMVPMSAPTTGTADVQVVVQSTGQILADGLVAMNTVSPAVFALGLTNCSLAGGKCRQAAVTNDADGTVNGPNNPAAAGSYISIYATGQGFLQGAPPDGNVPLAGLVQTSVLPQVWINACYVDDSNCTGETGVENVEFSGLSPQFPGVWQINVRIPKNTGPGAQVPLFIVMDNYTSQTGPTGYITTIAVKNQ